MFCQPQYAQSAFASDQCPVQFFQALRVPVIIGIKKGYETPLRMPQAEVPGRERAASVLLEILNPIGVLFCQPFHYLLRPIGGAVIHHHDFHRTVGLIKGAANRFFNVGGRIEAGHDDADEISGCHICPRFSLAQ